MVLAHILINSRSASSVCPTVWVPRIMMIGGEVVNAARWAKVETAVV